MCKNFERSIFTTIVMKMNCFGDLSFGEFASQYLGFGVLGGNNIDIDPGIEPVTEFNIDTITRRNYQASEGLDWSLTGDKTMQHFHFHVHSSLWARSGRKCNQPRPLQ